MTIADFDTVADPLRLYDVFKTFLLDVNSVYI